VTLKRAFLVDGVGAAVSAGFLGIVLPALQERIGMPTPVLYGLAGVAALFAVNALCAHRFAGDHAAVWLRGIVAANLAYCALTGSLVAWHFTTLEPLGLAYFLGEMAVLVVLVRWEGKALRRP
jgi:hypothetical protein